MITLCSVACRVRLLVTLWTVAHQAPLSMGISRQEQWAWVSRPLPGDLPSPGIEPTSLMSLALAGRFFTTSTTWEAPDNINACIKHAYMKAYLEKLKKEKKFSWSIYYTNCCTMKWQQLSQFCQRKESYREDLAWSHLESIWLLAFELKALCTSRQYSFHCWLPSFFFFLSSSLIFFLSLATLTLFTWCHLLFHLLYLLEATLQICVMCMFWYVCTLAECVLFCIHAFFISLMLFLAFLIKHYIFKDSSIWAFLCMSFLSLLISLLQAISLMCIHHILVILYPRHGKLVFFQCPAIVNDSVGSMNIFIVI